MQHRKGDQYLWTSIVVLFGCKIGKPTATKLIFMCPARLSTHAHSIHSILFNIRLCNISNNNYTSTFHEGLHIIYIWSAYIQSTYIQNTQCLKLAIYLFINTRAIYEMPIMYIASVVYRHSPMPDSIYIRIIRIFESAVNWTHTHKILHINTDA